MTSVICVRIRGRGSEVTTTPYHIRSDFRLKRRFYHDGFVVVFLCYLSHKHKTYRYSVQLGTLGVDCTIFRITLSVCASVRLPICHSVHVSDFVRTISPEPLNHFKPNLVWWCIITRQNVWQEKKIWFAIVNVKVTVRPYIIKIRLFLLYLPNC